MDTGRIGTQDTLCLELQNNKMDYITLRTANKHTYLFCLLCTPYCCLNLKSQENEKEWMCWS